MATPAHRRRFLSSVLGTAPLAVAGAPFRGRIKACVEHGRHHGVVAGLPNHNDFVKTADEDVGERPAGVRSRPDVECVRLCSVVESPRWSVAVGHRHGPGRGVAPPV
jgi:hypothetical protein